MTKEKIFITGATGFLGSYLTRKLVHQGFQVRALKRSTSRMDLIADVQDQIEWIEGDILDVPVLEDAMKGIDKVYHGAAMVSFDPRDHKKMMKVNVEGTANVVNVALYRQVKKLGYISSIAAVGRSADSHIVSEATKWEKSKINSKYAISKHQAEQEVWRGTVEGLPAVIINPTIILGAGFWNETSCKLFQRVDEGLKYYTSGATGFVDVRDVADILVNLVESDIENQRYVINGENMSYLDFFKKVAQTLHKPAPTTEATHLMKEIVWRAEWLRSRITGKSPLITKETATTSSHRYEYLNDKIVNELAYEFKSIDTSIQETAASYLNSKKEGTMFGVLK
jgi:nucleoside-diphosphate-sugar epimerase